MPVWGVQKWLIMYLGRWGSSSVEWYIAEAMAWVNAELSCNIAGAAVTGFGAAGERAGEPRDPAVLPVWDVLADDSSVARGVPTARCGESSCGGPAVTTCSRCKVVRYEAHTLS